MATGEHGKPKKTRRSRGEHDPQHERLAFEAGRVLGRTEAQQEIRRDFNDDEFYAAYSSVCDALAWLAEHLPERFRAMGGDFHLIHDIVCNAEGLLEIMEQYEEMEWPDRVPPRSPEDNE